MSPNAFNTDFENLEFFLPIQVIFGRHQHIVASGIFRYQQNQPIVCSIVIDRLSNESMSSQQHLQVSGMFNRTKIISVDKSHGRITEMRQLAVGKVTL